MAEKIDLLQAWREEMDNIFDKKVPTTEIGRKIYKNCMRFKLPKEEFLHLIDSIGMDVPNPVQAPDLNKFYRYCRGVAGVPGSLTLRILGCKDEPGYQTLPPLWAMRCKLPTSCAMSKKTPSTTACTFPKNIWKKPRLR